MAPSSISLLFRHFSQTSKLHHRLLRRHNYRSLSLSSSDSPKPSSLSSRLSFVFDKIDELEKDRAEKDEALQRIRAWRESKKLKESKEVAEDKNVGNDEKLGLGFDEVEKFEKVGIGLRKEIELAHPWPEWIELMERLVQQNYFDHRRKDEDHMIESLTTSFDEEGFDFTRDWKTVQTAVLNFGRDRFDIFRSLSRQDIQVLVGYGCPSADKKVVFSAKLLRKHAHLDEGDVCSTCSLRNTCEKAYLVTNKEDEARTIDVMRILLTYGFDPVNGSVENKSLLKQKTVKTVVRKLLREVVRLSAVPIDPNLPPPVIKQRPPKVKQPPPPPKKRVGRDDIEMKKGDWLCPKCNFMNFAKNVVCLQCDAKRPKRQLLPGEWECPQCNFLNYRRNMSCFNCEHKRPPDEYIENQMQSRQPRTPTRLERVTNRAEVSNAWNFDFDDDESDGADVAAFEYADSKAMNEDRLLDSQPESANFSSGRDEDLYRGRGTSRFQEREQSRPAQVEHCLGFNDFDDEEDDIDSYELDNQNRNKNQEASSVRFSDVEGYSESEGGDDLPGYSKASSSSSSYTKSSRSLRQKSAISDDLDFDSDEDLPVHPKWKSSHVADSGLRNRGSRGPFKSMSFSSDEDDKLVFGSDHELEEERDFKRNDRNAKQRSFRRQGDDSNRNTRRMGFGDHPNVNFVRSNNFDEEFGSSSRGSRGNHKSSFDNSKRDGQRMDGRRRGRRDFDGSRQRGSGYGGRRSFDDSDKWSDVDNERPVRQRINVSTQ